MGKKDVKKKPSKVTISKSPAKGKEKPKNPVKAKSAVKKISAVSSSAKKAAAKSSKPIKKSAAKAEKPQKLKVDKSISKPNKKADLKKTQSGSLAAKKNQPIEKSATSKPLGKEAKKSAAVELTKKKRAEPAEIGASTKPSLPSKKESDSAEDAKVSAKKASKTKKTEESGDLDDVGFISDELGDDEIGEYAEELKAVEEMDSESEEVDAWGLDSKDRGDEEIILTDAEGRRYCRSRDCDQIATVDGYCRYHYLLFWKKIQIRKKILADGKLEKYVEDLTSRYPDKFLEMIRRDLRTEKDFLSAIQELEIDEGAIENEFEEDAQTFIEEVRVMGESASVDDDDY